MELHHFSPDTSAEVLHEALARDGALIIDDLADVSLIDQINAEMAPHIEATPYGSDDFAGRTTKRTGNLIGRSPASRQLVQHPLVLDVTRRLLHTTKKIQVHLTQVITIEPGGPAQSIHRDQWAFDFYDFPADVHAQCNTIWALTNFTEANGATRLMPGSQSLPNDFGHTIDETVPAEMSKGSCLLYTGKVYHGGGENRSDETRMGLNLTYNMAWLRQEENQYLSVPAEVAATLDDELLKLMGYDLGAYALGYIDDVRHPIEVLRASTGAMSFGESAR